MSTSSHRSFDGATGAGGHRDDTALFDRRAAPAWIDVAVEQLRRRRGRPRRRIDAGIAETDPHVIFFTSGSTGRPKGAVLSHRVNVLRTHPGAQFEPRGVNVCMFPLFHMAGWTIAMSQWQARDAVVFVPADPVAIGAAVERHAAARLNCIPLVWRRILDAVAAGDVAADAFGSLRFADTGTSATPPELLDGDPRARPGRHGARLLRIDRGRERREPRSGRLRPEARSRRGPQPPHGRGG